MRFLENFDQNKKIYETISTKVEIIENSEQNQDFTLISTKIEILKISTKIEIFAHFD